MKYITGLLLLSVCFLFSSCGTARVMVKNCKNVGQNIYECEELK